MATGKQIRYYREKLDWTLDELSSRSGVEAGTISALENRDSERSKHFYAVAKALGLTLEQLSDTTTDWLSETKSNNGSGVYINFEMLNVEAAAGAGSIVVEFPEVIQRVNVLESWAKAALGGDLSRIKLVSARGTSMQGTIENGDVLFVDATIRAFDGDGVYVIARGGDVQVKRLQRLHGDVLAIISDNRAYESERLAGDDANAVTICGRVLAAWNLRKLW